MLVRTEKHTIDTNKLVAVDRISFDRVVVILTDCVLDLRGQEAQQAYSQITEQATDLLNLKED